MNGKAAGTVNWVLQADAGKSNKRQKAENADTSVTASATADGLAVGKARERSKGQQPLRVLHTNKANESIRGDKDDKALKAANNKKSTRKIIRAGSLVRK